MNIIDKINEKQINPNIPEFRVGDTVRVDVKIIEGKRERIQAFEGVVVARRGGSVSELKDMFGEVYDVLEMYCRREGISSFVDLTGDSNVVKVEENTNYGRKKILIVDDNNLNIKVAKRALSNFDFELDECTDGLQCLNKINSGNTYDLILMDIMMPNMGGETTLAKLKENPN